ncbi:hypothetical protein N0V85_008150 [Neurospora sp. IMI 360204]|nr:hypothetical protein N0V85_008150 [Neurospora sp. IMI 360204]
MSRTNFELYGAGSVARLLEMDIVSWDVEGVLSGVEVVVEAEFEAVGVGTGFERHIEAAKLKDDFGGISDVGVEDSAVSVGGFGFAFFRGPMVKTMASKANNGCL